jgi:hypothetical protein
MRSFRGTVLGALAFGLGCGSAPVVRPTPQTILGRCIWLRFTPDPPAIRDWVPPDTLRFLPPYGLGESSDLGGVNEGELDLPGDTNPDHFARWRLQRGALFLNVWTPLERRTIDFDRLSQFAAPSASISGRWYQRLNWRGTVVGRFIPCPTP